jgi:hypothetical protein
MEHWNLAATPQQVGKTPLPRWRAGLKNREKKRSVTTVTALTASVRFLKTTVYRAQPTLANRPIRLTARFERLTVPVF